MGKGKRITVHVRARNGRGAMGAVTVLLDARAAELAKSRRGRGRPMTAFLAEGIEYGLGDLVEAVHAFEVRQGDGDEDPQGEEEEADDGV